MQLRNFNVIINLHEPEHLQQHAESLEREIKVAQNNRYILYKEKVFSNCKAEIKENKLFFDHCFGSGVLSGQVFKEAHLKEVAQLAYEGYNSALFVADVGKVGKTGHCKRSDYFLKSLQVLQNLISEGAEKVILSYAHIAITDKRCINLLDDSTISVNKLSVGFGKFYNVVDSCQLLEHRIKQGAALPSLLSIRIEIPGDGLRIGTLNFVDIGSPMFDQELDKKIGRNMGLSMSISNLKNVAIQLTQASNMTTLPIEESTLACILNDFIGGNGVAWLILNLEISAREAVSKNVAAALEFGQILRKIKNRQMKNKVDHRVYFLENMCDSLKSENGQLKEQMLLNQGYIDELNQKVIHMENMHFQEINEINDALHDAKENILHLQKAKNENLKMVDQQKKLVHLEESSSLIEKYKKSELKRQLSVECVKQEVLISNLKFEHDQLKRTFETLKANFAVKEEELKQTVSDLKFAEAKINQMETEHSSALRSLNTDLDNYTLKLEEEQKKFHSNQEQMKELNTLFNQEKKENDDLKKKLKKTEDALQKATKEASTFMNEGQELKKELKKFESERKLEISNLSKEHSEIVKELKKEIASLKSEHTKQLSSLKSSHKEEIKDLKNTYSDYKSEHNEATLSLKQLHKEEIQNLNQILKSLREKSSNENSSNLETISRLEEELQEANKSAKSLKQAMSSLEKRNLDLKKELESANAIAESLKREMFSTSDEQGSQLAELQAEIQQLKKEKKASQDIVKKMESNHSKEKEELEAYIEELEKNSQELQQMSKTSSSNDKSFEEQQQKAADKISKLKQNLNEAVEYAANARLELENHEKKWEKERRDMDKKIYQLTNKVISLEKISALASCGNNIIMTPSKRVTSAYIVKSTEPKERESISTPSVLPKELSPDSEGQQELAVTPPEPERIPRKSPRIQAKVNNPTAVNKRGGARGKKSKSNKSSSDEAKSGHSSSSTPVTSKTPKPFPEVIIPTSLDGPGPSIENRKKKKRRLLGTKSKGLALLDSLEQHIENFIKPR